MRIKIAIQNGCDSGKTKKRELKKSSLFV